MSYFTQRHLYRLHSIFSFYSLSTVFFNNFYWGIVDFPCCVFHVYIKVNLLYILHISTLFQILFPYRSLQSTENSSPCFIVYSVQFSCSVMFDSLQPHELQHTRLPCPSPTPRACSNSCSSSWWCHPTISSSVVPFSAFCFIYSGVYMLIPISQYPALTI